MRQSYIPNGSGYTWNNDECLFAALRDRAPGALFLGYHYGAGFIKAIRRYTFLLDGSDQATVLTSGYDAIVGMTMPDNTLVTYSTRLCVLEDPTMFDACLDDPTGCATIEQWFQTCRSDAVPDCPTD